MKKVSLIASVLAVACLLTACGGSVVGEPQDDADKATIDPPVCAASAVEGCV